MLFLFWVLSTFPKAIRNQSALTRIISCCVLSWFCIEPLRIPSPWTAWKAVEGCWSGIDFKGVCCEGAFAVAEGSRGTLSSNSRDGLLGTQDKALCTQRLRPWLMTEVCVAVGTPSEQRRISLPVRQIWHSPTHRPTCYPHDCHQTLSPSQPRARPAWHRAHKSSPTKHV